MSVRLAPLTGTDAPTATVKLSEAIRAACGGRLLQNLNVGNHERVSVSLTSAMRCEATGYAKARGIPLSALVSQGLALRLALDEADAAELLALAGWRS